MTDAPGGPGDGDCRLRLLLINDVYELQNWPRFCTAVRELCRGKTIVVLAGDFVSPSLLSKFDSGRGMIDCMNRCGIQYVCFGNHEADIPQAELIQRMEESEFTWINSNIANMDSGGVSLPDHVTLEVKGSRHTKRVGLLGLVTEDPSIFVPGPFGGATILSLADTAERLRNQLVEQEEVDLVIPITHQSMARDRQFALRFEQPGTLNGNAFPLVLGGHDHARFKETVGGAHIVKTSFDIREIAVCDLLWPDPSGQRVEISSCFHPITDFAVDAAMQGVVDGHLAVLKALDTAPLLVFGAAESLTSKQNRLRETSLCSRLCSDVRDALASDCCMLNAGSIRGNADYGGGSKPFLSYNDLISEICWDCEVVVVGMPGHVLQAALEWTRRSSLSSPPQANPAFLHTDDRMRTHPSSLHLELVAGAPFDPSRRYATVVQLELLVGVDKIEPLVSWARGCVCQLLESAATSAGSRTLKSLLVAVWSRALWWQLGPELRSYPEAGREEVAGAAQRVAGVATVPEAWVSNVVVAGGGSASGTVGGAARLRAVFFDAGARRGMGWDGLGDLRKEGVRRAAQTLLCAEQAGEAAEAVWRELSPSAQATACEGEAVRRWMAKQLEGGGGLWIPGESGEREELRMWQQALRAWIEG